MGSGRHLAQPVVLPLPGWRQKHAAGHVDTGYIATRRHHAGYIDLGWHDNSHIVTCRHDAGPHAPGWLVLPARSWHGFGNRRCIRPRIGKAWRLRGDFSVFT